MTTDFQDLSDRHLFNPLHPLSYASNNNLIRKGTAMTELIYSDLTYEVRGAIFDIYNELHSLDLSEEGWENALEIALKERGMCVRRQVEYELRYKGYRIGRFFVDMLVEEKLLLELKAETKLLPIDKAQVITYLGVTGLRLGMLINFGGHELEIERIPNFVTQHRRFP